MLAAVLALSVSLFALQSPQSEAPQPEPPAAAAQLSPADFAQLLAKAQTGDPAAQLAVANAFYDGMGVRQNDVEALKWYRKAADQGTATAQNRLGLMYRLGRGVDENKEEAIKWYRQAALQKLPNAMFNMGTVYYNGDGVPINDTEACAWFMLAEEAGSESAAEAVKRMRTTAAKWVEEAALERIGEMYANGDGLPQQPGESLKWYRKVAPHASSALKLKLASLLITSPPPFQDYAEARLLCEQVRDGGPGAYCLGLIYQNGYGVPVNLPEAAKWFKNAANWGHARAMLVIGEMLWKGTGVTPDKVSAYALFLLASRAKVDGAEADKLALQKELTPKEIQEAEKKSKQWLGPNFMGHPRLKIR